METKPEIKRKRNIISLYSGSRIMFSQMDKFQCWVACRDVTWTRMIGLCGLMTFELTPIQHLVKEFL